MKRIIYYFVIALLIAVVVPYKVFATSYYDKQNYLYDIKYYNINYSSTKKGDGIVVAVIDTGVWLSHPNLVGRNWVNTKEIANNGIDDDGNGYIDDYYGWNFLDNNSDLTVKANHGTAVAGIIAANDTGDGIRGIASQAKIMPLIVCSDYGCPTQSIVSAIRYAADNGANVINLSLGSSNGYVGYSSDYDAAISYAYIKGLVIVASAGNGDVESSAQLGLNLDMFKVSPVCNKPNGNKMVLAIGASNVNKLTSWTNFGSIIDVYAPGENMIGLTVPALSQGYGYKLSWSGTSFSAPIVSGLVAILESNYPRLNNTDIMKAFSLTSKFLDTGDLYYTAVGKVMNEKGAVSNPPIKNDTKDTQAPNGAVVKINNGETETDKQIVTLNLSASDTNPISMIISNDPNFIGASWENLSTNKSWSLTNGYGIKTIFVKFKDSVGNESPIVSSSINYVQISRVKKPTVSVDKFVVVNTNINVRQKPSTTAKILGLAKTKSKYKVLDNANKLWVKIKYNNKEGWVIRKSVSIL
ncbi:MAG: S8 family serine peptidase [Candidatus Falkowbacteria bacterium]|nr:S8 family serine peptidase [Candidatus Falkowbacteria bacterium]